MPAPKTSTSAEIRAIISPEQWVRGNHEVAKNIGRGIPQSTEYNRQTTSDVGGNRFRKWLPGHLEIGKPIPPMFRLTSSMGSRLQSPDEIRHRHLVSAAFALFIALGLSACGGGGGGSPASSPAAPASDPVPANAQPTLPTPKTILIEQYGDSTVYGQTNDARGNPVQSPQAAPVVLQGLLRTKYGASVTILNQGVPGTSAEQLLNGDGVHPKWQDQMAQSKANIVTIRFGINDSANGPGFVPMFSMYEDQLVSIAKAAGKTVVLENSSPVMPAPYAALPQYAQATLTVAKTWGIPSVDLYGYLIALSNWDSMLSDGIHPTAVGYSIIAQQELTIIGPIVKVAMAN
ncbi:SGNH/GDSL hydrolase family protein [Trinickia sp.]|uniref:SGNH/GDSL hydrolase family protein n=1 Tax=Trinickia sp. TaxID=2571163 RepID=UPI003F7D3C3A